jgi:hypothetical protein
MKGMTITFSNQEVERFANLFGENRTLFDRSIALLEGERGPWSIVLTEDEVNKLKGLPCRLLIP